MRECEKKPAASQISALLEQWKTSGKIKSHSEVARALELSPASLQYFANGKINPKIETLIEIANYFGVTTDYLLGREISAAVPIEITIENYTGLSVEAVKKLHLAATDYLKTYTLETLSKIIEETAFLEISGDIEMSIRVHIKDGKLDLIENKKPDGSIEYRDLIHDFTVYKGSRILQVSLDGITATHSEVE